MRITVVLIIGLLFSIHGFTQSINPSGPVIFCEGGSVTLTVSPTTGITGYQWTKNGANILNDTAASFSANSNGSYRVRLKRGLLPDTTIGPVVVIINPRPDLKVSAGSVCVGESTNLIASGADSYTWSPPTGLSSTSGSIVTASPANTSIYTVIGINSFGCLDTATSTVTVNPFPSTPAFTFTGNGQCANASFTFNVTAPVAGNTYTWDFGDASPAVTGLSVSHLFNTAIGNAITSFNVSVKATSPANCNSVSAPQTVTVKQKPSAAIADFRNNPPFTNCVSTTTSTSFNLIVDNVSTTIETNKNYKIDWGDGLDQYNETILPLTGTNHTYNSLGYFTIRHTVTGENGCEATSSYTVYNGSNPGVGLSSNGSTILQCLPSTDTFFINNTTNNPPGTTYTVSFNDGSPSIIFQHPAPPYFIHNFTTSSCGASGGITPNTFFVRIRAQNPCGFLDGAVEPVTTITRPTARFTASPDSIACIENPITFTNTSIAGTVVQNNGVCDAGTIPNWVISPSTGWTVVSGSVGSVNPSNNPITWGSQSLGIKFNVPGTYSIMLIVRNNSIPGTSCRIDSIARSICVTTRPIPSFKLNNVEGCSPLNVTALNNTTSLNNCSLPTYSWKVTYAPDFCGTDSSWAFTNGTSASSTSPSFIFRNPGAYTITLSVTNVCGTFDTSMVVNVKKPPIVAIAPLSSSCGVSTLIPSATVQACTTGTLSYAWTFDGGLPGTAGIPNPGNVTFSAAGPHLVTLSVTNECGTTTDNITIQIDTVTIANAGPSQNICGNTATMAANVPVIGTGQWLRVSGPGNVNFTSPSSPTTTITGLVAGTYIFRWTIINKTCVSNSDVTVTIYPGPSPAIAGPDQNLCLNTATTLVAVAPVTGSGTWTQVSGPNAATITAPAVASTTVNGLVPGIYTFRWTVTFSNCVANIDDVLVAVYNNPSEANAGPDQLICASVTSLAANIPVTGNGMWSQAGTLPNNATIANAASPTTMISGLIPGIYQFIWTITNGPCNSTADTAEINVTAVATTPNAGTDIRLCGVSTITLAGNTATVGTGTWSVIGGPPGAAILNTSLPNTGVTNLVPGTYTFRWTIINGNCPPVNDDVQVIIDENVTAAIAGPSQNVCGSTVTMAANTPTTGTGSWSLISGPAGSSINTRGSPTTVISGLVPSTYVFRWTITNGSCSSNSEVTVIIAAGAGIPDAGPDQQLCLSASTTLSGNKTGSGTGAWSLVDGPAGSLIMNPDNSSTIVNGLVPGTYTFRYTVNFSNCTPNTDEVQVIVYDNPSLSNAGPDQTICAAASSFAANKPVTGNGTWRQLNGPNTAGIADPTSPVSAVSRLVPGDYTFTWTITNGPCEPTRDTFHINVSAIATAANAGPDQTFCAVQSINLLANVPVIGVGSWSFVNGPNTPSISTAGNSSTIVTGLIPGTYTFRWTIINGVCAPSTDDVQIVILDSLQNKITALTNTICAGQSISINGAFPLGGNGTYNYQWQQSADGNTWTDINGENNRDFAGSLQSTTYLRRKVSSLPCENFSNVVQIIVQPGITNNTISANDSICINTPATIIAGSTPTGGDGTFTYQWQQSLIGGAWNNIPGEISINYNPGVLTETTQYRRLVSTLLCSGAQSNISNTVTITINPDSKAAFTGSPVLSCSPFLLNPVISVNTFPDRNLSYTWYADGIFFGSNSTGIFPEYTITNPGDTIVIKLVTSSRFGCKTDSTEQPFITVTKVIASFTKDTSGGCGPLDETFSNTSNIINNTIQFFWNFGNGVTSTLPQPGTIKFVQSPFFSDTTYQITLKAYNGCDTTIKRDSIRIRSNPKARFGIDTTSGCSPFTAHITNNSLGGPNTYYWDFGNGHKDTTFTTGQLNYTYNTGNVVDTFPIRLIAVNECTSDTQITNVRIAPNAIKPQVTINGSDLFGCTPHTVTFNNASIGATQFTWDFGDNTAPVITNNSQPTVTHTFNVAGIFNIAIRMTNGCSDTTATRQVTVFAKPTADFVTSNGVYCLGDSTRINNSSLNANTYSWFWGDGESSIGAAPAHLYTTAGNYTIKLTAGRTGISGIVCSDTMVQSIRVLSKPEVSVQTNIATVNCSPFTLNATAPGIINESVSWYISDTTVSGADIVKSGTSVQYTFLKAGTFRIKMVAVNASGCRDSATRTLVVRSTPVAGFTPMSLAVCTTDTAISYLNTSTFNSNEPVTFRWLTNGIQRSATGNFSFRYVAPANTVLPITFTTQLIATNAAGCSDTSSGVLQMNPVAKAQFNISNANSCVPFNLPLANTSQYGTSFKWLLNGALVDTAASPVIRITKSSTPYTVTLIADNVYGCGPDTFSVKFVSRIKPLAAFTLSDTLGCTGVLNILTRNQSVNGGSYQWDWGDNSATSTLFNTSHLYNTPGKYLVTLIASDGVCKDTINKLVTVANKPIVKFSANDTLTCDTARLHFTNLTTNADNYLWNFGDGTFSMATDPMKNFAPGSLHYSVTLVAANNAGCRDSLTKPNLIFAIIPPTADFLISPSPVITVPDYTFTFNNLSLNNTQYTYLWSLGDGAYATTRDVTHKYADTGSYPVMLIVLDNSTGCPDTTIKVAVINGNPGYLYVPNAFYPNSLRNEFKTFKPLGRGLADYRLQIFDSWGKLLFETRELDGTGSPAVGWDGTNKGKPMPQDAYAWRIIAHFKSGKLWDGMSYGGNLSGKPGNTFGTLTLFR